MENVFTNEQVLGLGVTQDAYDNVSLNRKSTFINLYDNEGEYVTSANTLDMKGGSDFLFLAEVLRAGEFAGLVPVNSLCEYKGLTFRLAAVQTSKLQSNLKINMAKKEDFKKVAPPQQPVQNQPIQNQQQAVF